MSKSTLGTWAALGFQRSNGRDRISSASKGSAKKASRTPGGAVGACAPCSSQPTCRTQVLLALFWWVLAVGWLVGRARNVARPRLTMMVWLVVALAPSLALRRRRLNGSFRTALTCSATIHSRDQPDLITPPHHKQASGRGPSSAPSHLQQQQQQPPPWRRRRAGRRWRTRSTRWSGA